MTQKDPHDSRPENPPRELEKPSSQYLIEQEAESSIEQQDLHLLQEVRNSENGIFRRSYLHVIRTLRLKKFEANPHPSATTSGSRSLFSGANHGIVITGDSNTIHVDAGSLKQIPEGVRRREATLNDTIRESYRQTQITFRLSLIFTSIGSAIFLFSSAFAAFQAITGQAASASLASSLGGALLAGSGAAIALRADNTRKYLGEQAKIVHDEVRDEYRMTQATGLLNSISDSDLKDRLLAAMALRRLDSSIDIDVILGKLVQEKPPVTSRGKDEEESSDDNRWSG